MSTVYRGGMRIGAGVEWGIHCCVVISRADGPVPAQKLAEYHDVSRTYLAKALQALSRAGIVQTTEGRSGGYVMARPAADVSLNDIITAIEGPGPVFQCTEIRQNGPFGAKPAECTAPCGVAKAMYDAETAWRASLSGVTIADLAAHVGEVLPPERAAAISSWLGR